MNYTQARSTDKKGNDGWSYIDENGLAYKDPQGKERVDIGTTVFTQGGPYTRTTSGSVKTPRGIYDDLKTQSDKALGQLGDMNDANQRAIKSQTDKQVARINDQKRTAAQNYEDANRAAYQAYIQASNPYGAAAEQQAKIGLDNSGYAETSKMRIANTYQNAINNNVIARNEYMNELENARRDALYNGDIESARALSEYARLVYDHGIDTAERLASQGNLAYNTAISQDDKLWEREYQLGRDAREDELENAEIEWQREQDTWSRALQLAKIGISNAQIASILGISLSELNRISDKYR